MSISPRQRALIIALTPCLLLCFADAALATPTGGTAPWETSLTALQAILTGTVAKTICIIAIFIAGVALIFGEDLGAFAKRLLTVVIAASIIMFCAAFMTSFFAGALI